VPEGYLEDIWGDLGCNNKMSMAAVFLDIEKAFDTT
jgi:hypothetical protein